MATESPNKDTKHSLPETVQLPPVPDKRYFTIGEVSELCGVQSHVLRYWEDVFPQLRPNRRLNRRYYQRTHLMMVRRIRSLLYEQGYTIKGARQVLSSNRSLDVYKKGDAGSSRTAVRETLSDVVKELERVADKLSRYDK